MNELIEKLWEKYSSEQTDEDNVSCGYMIDKEDFKQAIQTVRQAQRNACKREYLHSVRELNTTKINDLANDINSAEITEADYE